MQSTVLSTINGMCITFCWRGNYTVWDTMLYSTILWAYIWLLHNMYKYIQCFFTLKLNKLNSNWGQGSIKETQTPTIINGLCNVDVMNMNMKLYQTSKKILSPFWETITDLTILYTHPHTHKGWRRTWSTLNRSSVEPNVLLFDRLSFPVSITMFIFRKWRWGFCKCWI